MAKKKMFKEKSDNDVNKWLSGFCKTEDEKRLTMLNLFQDLDLLCCYPSSEKDIDGILLEVQVMYLLEDNVQFSKLVEKAIALAVISEADIKGDLFRGSFHYSGFPFTVIADYFDWSQEGVYNIPPKVLVSALKRFVRDLFWKNLWQMGGLFLTWYYRLGSYVRVELDDRLSDFVYKMNKVRNSVGSSNDKD